jgi:hypothetical protein
MSRDLPESDWKIFRELRSVALERFCERVLTEVAGHLARSDSSFHDRYIAIYRLLERRDRELARAFDAPRRSQMIAQLGAISVLGLLEPSELRRFTPATRDAVAAMAEIIGSPRRRRE